MFTDIIRELVSGNRRLAVVGLGYAGLPLCVEFGKVFRAVIGFDTKEERIKGLLSGIDIAGEIPSNELKKLRIEFTSVPERLRDAAVIIVAVPTPIDEHKIPDLRHLESASQIIGENLSPETIVVYESTVYPGVTEEFCAPLLGKYSGLKCGRDFKVGYSPERINPGDRVHTLPNIVKVVAGQDAETTEILAEIYGAVVKAGIHKTSNIKTAEAAKVIENIQRDLNIALVNELSIIFHKFGLDTKEVLDAAATKWNFLRFEPGLVGGHCIGVDPYYLTFKTQALGYHPEVILAGRRINDSMGKYVAEQTIKQLIKSGRTVKGSRILILGITFKENIGDIRNSRVIDIYSELKEYGVEPYIHDPYASKSEVEEEYGIYLTDRPEDGIPFDGIILAVRHDIYLNLSIDYLKGLCNGNAVLIDVKNVFDKKAAKLAGFNYWRL